ncbi:hypothetical protein D3C73_867710 [compost metagenome]
MADHVAGVEEGEADALHIAQYVDRIAQAGLHVLGQVGLGQITGDHGGGAEAQAGQEHLHLFDGGVLRFVQDHERIVERAATHVGQRRDLDDVLFQQLEHFFHAQHFIQGVVQGSQVRVDLLAQVAGQEAQLLAGFDCRTHQDQALHARFVQCFHRAGYRQKGLAGAGRADAEVDVVADDLVQVAALVGTAPAHGTALDLDCHVLRFVGAIGDLFDVRRVQAQVDAVAVEGGLGGLFIQRLDQLLCLCTGFSRAADTEHEAAVGDFHAKLQFDLAKVAVERAAQVGQLRVVFRRQGEVSMLDAFHCLGWGGVAVHRDGVRDDKGNAQGGRTTVLHTGCGPAPKKPVDSPSQRLCHKEDDAVVKIVPVPAGFSTCGVDGVAANLWIGGSEPCGSGVAGR